MAIKRILIGVVALVVVGLGVALYLLISNLDSIVEGAIEQYGSELAGTAVRVASVSIEITAGRGTIHGLTIDNPRGFESDHAFRLAEITLDIDAIVIRAPEATYEMNASGQSNIQIIRGNLERARDSGGAEDTSDQGAGEATRVAIKRLVFEQGKVRAGISAVGGVHATVALPALPMSNLGGTRGATGAELGRTVLSAYTRQVLKAVATDQLDHVIDKELGGAAGQASKKLLRGLLD